MYHFTKMLGASVAYLFVFSTMFAANAADTSRAMVGGNRATQVARMPVMAVLPTNAVGNVAVDVEKPASDQPQPGPQPEPQPDPKPECPDGGVRNSEYTVNDCMNEVLSCINNGALSGGLNDLFNEDMRNAIVNGMGLLTCEIGFTEYIILTE